MIISHSRRRHLNLSRGFTLVELLVVIAIIGVLATLVLLQLGTARSRARDAKRIADVNQLRSAIELYYEDNGGKYPDDLTTGTIGKYLNQVPNDPLDGSLKYGYITKDNTNQQYMVWAELEQKTAGALNADADIDSTAWTGVGNGRTGGDKVNGATETCPDATVTNNNCIYDQGQT